MTPYSQDLRQRIIETAQKGGATVEQIAERFLELPGTRRNTCRKYVSRAYLRAAEMLSLAPAECLMVAAHNSDLHAAAKCGFRTAFIRRPYEYGAIKKYDLVADTGIELDCADMNDLADKLGC